MEAGHPHGGRSGRGRGLLVMMVVVPRVEGHRGDVPGRSGGGGGRGHCSSRVVVVVRIRMEARREREELGERVAEVGREGRRHRGRLRSGGGLPRGRGRSTRSRGGGGARRPPADGAAHVPAHELLLLLVRVPDALVARVHAAGAGVVRRRVRRRLVVVVAVVRRRLVVVVVSRVVVRGRPGERRVVGRLVVLHAPDGVEKALVPGRRRGGGGRCRGAGLVRLRGLARGGAG